jgi:Skp family chaperone for outer membrane proteins
MIRRSPAVDDLRTLVLGDLEAHFAAQQAELHEALFGELERDARERDVQLMSAAFSMSREDAERKLEEDRANRCAAALEASKEERERERERLRRRRLAVAWLATARGKEVVSR